jgi:hypothetical protein
VKPVAFLFLAVTAGPVSAQPKNDLLQAYALVDSAPAMRMTIQTKLGSSDFSEIFELVRPHRFHCVIKHDGQTDEVFLVDGTIALRQGAGWLRATPSYVPNPTPIDQWIRQIFTQSLTQVDFVGNEPLNGLSTAHYRTQFSFHDALNSEDATCDAWVAADTHLPTRMKCTGTTRGVVFQNQSDYEYGPSIVITAP